MATPVSKVYDAFLARILEDEWQDWLVSEAEQDWRQILDAALPWFKFPRTDLTIVDNHGTPSFSGDLSVREVQILANYMKCEWLNRCIMTWENVKPLYEERDFSQANLLDKLEAMLVQERNNALDMESIYYRSREDNKPFDFSKLAGSGN